MRRTDRNKYSIKVLIILALLAGNIVVALPRHRASQSKAPAPVPTATFSGRMHQAVPVEKDLSSLAN
jgi:hypothetical protein